MFITFYDSNFNAISDNSSLVVESYDLKRRAYDLNEFTAVCEPIDLTTDPFFAVLREPTQDGSYYTMLAPIVTRNAENKSEVVARDLLGVFNTEVLIDFSSQSFSSVAEYLDFIFNAWKNFDESGFDNVVFNTDEITITATVYAPTEKGVYNIKEVLNRAFLTYNIYIKGAINLKTETLVFTAKNNAENTVKIKLEEFGIIDFNKTQPSVNTAIAFNENYSVRHDWYLLKSGAITGTAGLRDVFPSSAKVIVEENIADADFESISLLAENRYQEKINIDTKFDKDRLEDIDFGNDFDVYYKNAFYKTLPLGEIHENYDRGMIKNKILVLGYAPNEFIQLI